MRAIEKRTYGRVLPRVLALVMGCMCFVATRVAAEPVTFVTSFPRTEGGSRPMRFEGDLSASTVAGTLEVDGQRVGITATMSGSRITGRFEVAGQEVGRFWAVREGRELRGGHELNGEVGSWAIPFNELPAAARDALRGATTQ